MRTIKIHSMAAVFGLCLAPALAAAADEPAAPAVAVEAAAPAPTEPPAGTPAAAAAPSTLINVDVEGASAYVWRGMNLFGEKQNTQDFSVFPSLTATFGGLS